MHNNWHRLFRSTCCHCWWLRYARHICAMHFVPIATNRLALTSNNTVRMHILAWNIPIRIGTFSAAIWNLCAASIVMVIRWWNWCAVFTKRECETQACDRTEFQLLKLELAALETPFSKHSNIQMFFGWWVFGVYDHTSNWLLWTHTHTIRWKCTLLHQPTSPSTEQWCIRRAGTRQTNIIMFRPALILMADNRWPATTSTATTRPTHEPMTMGQLGGRGPQFQMHWHCASL